MTNKGIKYWTLIILFITLGWSCKDDFDYAIPPAKGGNTSSPEKYRDGITRVSGDSLAFKLFAPGKSTVYLVGDFNKWQKNEKYKMAKDEATNRFFIKIGNLEEGKEYICQYLIDETILVADPYASKVSDPNDKYIPASTYPNLIAYPVGMTSEIAMVVSTTQKNYNWSVTNFKIEQPENMVIYELFIRDFTGELDEVGTINATKEKLPYLKSLGVNVIELMPFNEFEGNSSWGYNPSFFFATDKAYGTDNDYKDFIDACHKEGIGVIMDMVLNHSYGQNPMVRMYVEGDGKIATDNPWFNRESPNKDYSWGYDFNHESVYTKQFVDSVCSFWMKEFKIDGFRFDFTKGFTNTPTEKGEDGGAYDASRIDILKRMTTEIWKRKSDAVVIFEHLADNAEEKVLSDHGIYLWGNMNGNFNESTMGWGEEMGGYGFKGDVSWASYKERGWTKSTLVSYMESHDEERLMFKNEQYGKEDGTYSVKNIPTGLKRVGATAAIYFTIPGPKMIWQFGELGYDYELGSSMEDGRLDPKPARWDYLEDTDRKALHDVYAKMIALKKEYPAFKTTNYTMDVKGNYKQILLTADKNVCAIANLGTQARTETVNFGKAGTWKEQFTNADLPLANFTSDITLQPGEFRVYISN